LCLNENLIENLKGIEKFPSLKNLQINFNLIEKLEYLENSNLEKLWICENKIRKIENLPDKLISLWIGTNYISKLDEHLLKYDKITDLNLSANLLSSFKDLFILTQMNNLENLNLNDPNFGENPICLINNYRLSLLHKMPNLKILDEIFITTEERQEYNFVYAKKSNFYKNKIIQINRISKLTFKLLKIFGWFFKIMKFLQIFFFRKRIKMLQYIQFERICQNILKNDQMKSTPNNLDRSIFLNENQNELITETHKKDESDDFYVYIDFNNTLCENISNDELIEEMNKEIDITNDKIKKCISNFEMIDNNYYQIKNYISEVNDFSIIW